MGIISTLLESAEKFVPSRLDVFQYMSKTPMLPELPYNIRVFLRMRMASKLGKALHNQHTLAVALRTSGGAILDNRFLRLVPGSALLIFPRQVHDYIDLESDEVLWLFCGFLLDDNEKYKPLKNSPVKLCRQSICELEAILNDALSSQKNVDNDARGMRLSLRLKLLLEELLDNRWQELSSSEDDKSMITFSEDENELVTMTCQYISRHLQETISIDDIADSQHVSPGHLRNEFRRRTGCSLGRYIRYIKMHNACTLMNTTALSLAEIGERCGYSSIYAFSRAFKKETGIAPSEYRTQWNKE